MLTSHFDFSDCRAWNVFSLRVRSCVCVRVHDKAYLFVYVYRYDCAGVHVRACGCMCGVGVPPSHWPAFHPRK